MFKCVLVRTISSWLVQTICAWLVRTVCLAGEVRLFGCYRPSKDGRYGPFVWMARTVCMAGTDRLYNWYRPSVDGWNGPFIWLVSMDRFMAGTDLLYSWYSPSVNGLNRTFVCLVQTVCIAGSDHLYSRWLERTVGMAGTDRLNSGQIQMLEPSTSVDGWNRTSVDDRNEQQTTRTTQCTELASLQRPRHH